MSRSRMGATLFRHRLAVIIGFFLLAMAVALLSATSHDVGALVALRDLIGLHTVFVPAGVACLVAFGLRTWGEATLGGAVYGQSAASHVVTSGPYRIMRHPLYVGTWLFFVAAVAPYVPIVFLVVSGAAFATTLRAIAIHEEQHLETAHGDAWRLYAHAAPQDVRVRQATTADAEGPSARAWLLAALSNLGMASLGVYRLAVVGELNVTGLGALNVACLTLWLVVVIVRRIRER